MTAASIYTKATLVFLGQLIVWFLEKNWGLVLAALAGWGIYQLVASDVAIFHALVIGPEGAHAVGQRVFGVFTAR